MLGMYKHKHILVIDDDRKLGDLLKSYLTAQGYLVDLAEDTSTAKKKMLNIIYDLPEEYTPFAVINLLQRIKATPPNTLSKTHLNQLQSKSSNRNPIKCTP